MATGSRTGLGLSRRGIVQAVVLVVVALAGLAPRVSLAGICATRLEAGLHAVTVTTAGQSRVLQLFVPRRVRAGTALALVFDLHGSGGNGESQAQVSRLRVTADRYGFLVANPDGAITRPGAPDEHFWNIPGVPLSGGGDAPADAGDDVQFISDAIDAIAAQACIDSHRVYATGMSGGGRMASLLACRLSQRIAAVAPVDGLRAGLPGPGADHAPPPEACAPARPVPILTFHGTDDQVNPYMGYGAPYWAYSVPVALQRWAAINQCTGGTVAHRVARHVVETDYLDCPAGADIVLYRVEAAAEQGGGHAWPGGGTPPLRGSGPAPAQFRSTTEIDASTLIWRFFRRHRLPG